jgi:sarcosine oxidase
MFFCVMDKRNYDAIVIGTGAIGSALCYFLARKGYHVIAFDRYAEKGLLDAPIFVQPFSNLALNDLHYLPLLQQAKQAWQELADTTSLTILQKQPLMAMGKRYGKFMAIAEQIAAQAETTVAELKAQDVKDYFNHWQLTGEQQAFIDHDALLIHPGRCIEKYLELAHLYQFQHYRQCPVWALDIAAKTVAVETPKGRFQAAKLFFTCGTWYKDFVSVQDLGICEQSLPFYSLKPRFSLRSPLSFMGEGQESSFYGFQNMGSKQQWTLSCQAKTSSDTTFSWKEIAELKDHFTAVNGASAKQALSQVCYFPDRYPRLGNLQASPHIWYALGLSDSSFNFSNILAKLLADWADQGSLDAERQLLLGTMLKLQ